MSTKPVKQIAPKNFGEWFNKNKPDGVAVMTFVMDLQKKSGVSRTTILGVLRGYKLRNYGKAKALEALTGLPAAVFLEG